MGNLICTFLKVEEFKGKNGGDKYYVLNLLTAEDKVLKSFFKDEDLFKEFKQLPKMTDIELAYELYIKYDGALAIKPNSILTQ